MSGCKVENCTNRAVAKGLCDKHRKRQERHGHLEQTRSSDWGQRTSHPLYKMWHGMIRRCHDPKSKSFVDYGSRGIVVCDQWRNDFWSFLHDMGPRPSTAHTVGRINNDGNYSPQNCEWQTPTQQARNRRTSVLTEDLAREIKRRAAMGERAADIAKAMGIQYDHVRNVIVGICFTDVQIEKD